MKQTDWIVIGVAAVLALGAAGAFYGTRPTPETLAAPEQVNVKPAVAQGGDVKLATSLPGGGNAGAPAGPSGGGGRMGGGPEGGPPGRMNAGLSAIGN